MECDLHVDHIIQQESTNNPQCPKLIVNSRNVRLFANLDFSNPITYIS